MPESHNIDHDVQEAGLVLKAQRGDAQAYGQLYEQYAPLLFRFLNAHLDNPLDAEDLTTEVFVRAWRSLDGYQPRGLPFKAYLFRVARNLVIDLYRQRKRSVSSVALEEETVTDWLPGPDQALQHSVDGRELRQLLSGLREEYRMVVVLRFLSGLSPQETAQVMGKSVSAVRVLHHRALNALRKKMDEEHGQTE